MKFYFRKVFVFLSSAIIGSAVTFGIFFAFQLFSFQTDFYKAFKTYQMVLSGYYKPVPANELVDGAIQGMLETLRDPYTEYMRQEETVAFNESFLGEIEGIGVDIRVENGQVVVISPVHASPAEKAGLLPNDIILEVNGNRLDGLSLDGVAQLIRGPKGSTVSLLIRRSGIESDFLVIMQRDTIPTETVIYTKWTDDIAIIKITEFAESTADEFEEALRILEENRMKGLVLDLRQNSGGMVSRAIDIASHFVPKGEPIVTLEFKDRPAIRYDSDQVAMNLPVVVLIDEGSASSAEVLAGALRDSAEIPLIGRKTYGKGIAQNVTYFSDGSMMKYTHSEMLTPSGFRYHGIGLTPDVDVSLPVYARYPLLHLNETYKLGDQSQEISLAQKYLEALSFNPGRKDGVFDQKTATAVKKMQAKANLALTGELDASTATAMVEKLGELLKENDTQLKKAVDVLKERIRP